ncbi:MAG: hypothetical protein WCK41_08180 [Actinomycetes bacterium]
MAQYDPQRSNSRQRKADNEGPAPVDALLGIDTNVETTTDNRVDTTVEKSHAPDRSIAPTPVWTESRAVSRHQRKNLIPGLAVLFATLAIVLWVTRRKNRAKNS